MLQWPPILAKVQPHQRVQLTKRDSGTFNASAFVIKTGSTTQWQAYLAPKEMAASDMMNRRHVQLLILYSWIKSPYRGSICVSARKGPTCCTSRMEHQLSTQSREEYDKLLHTSLSKLHAMLNFHAERLDEFFKELMRKTKEEFHQMFLKTYGLLYSENSYIFEDMFKDLETYYLAGRGNLAVAMDAFFTRLYKKMFEKINSQYTFSSSYLECVGSHMSSLKPFGDSPQKMTTEIRRAFIAMRTFVKSLREVRKVVKDMMEVAVFPECSRALMRMTYCPHCYGEPQLPPCPSYCMNVLRGCLAYHADLDPNWNLFVDLGRHIPGHLLWPTIHATPDYRLGAGVSTEAMVTLAFQLESAFNLETVIDPLNIKISEAIMNFQENGVAISKKIFEECGQPRLRQKRQVFGEEDEDTTNAAAEVVSGPLQFNYHGSRTPTVRGTSLDRLVVGAKKQLRQTKSFWSHLGDLLCNSNYLRPMPAGNLQPCWDGKTRTLRYPYNVTSPGLASQKTNPEVRMDPTKLNYAVNQKILALKMVATRLSQAYNGLDVHWPMENGELSSFRRLQIELILFSGFV
ncbi:GPC4 [Cordylochernes scorpioides]|uniref:GPC4 n=1 Tax=Cordylochernes scorpioides TaxID=51811 RepID=A0ABY6L1K8_9ARAC|nr:GPC4 [Cordylochernes scorpioides]